MENREILEDELETLERLKVITLKRKLNAGILFIPDGLTCSIEDERDPEEIDDKTFEEELIGALVDSYNYAQDTGKVIPVIVRGSADLLSQVRKITFDDGMIDIDDIERRIEIVKERLER